MTEFAIDPVGFSLDLDADALTQSGALRNVFRNPPPEAVAQQATCTCIGCLSLVGYAWNMPKVHATDVGRQFAVA